MTENEQQRVLETVTRARVGDGGTAERGSAGRRRATGEPGESAKGEIADVGTSTGLDGDGSG